MSWESHGIFGYNDGPKKESIPKLKRKIAKLKKKLKKIKLAKCQ